MKTVNIYSLPIDMGQVTRMQKDSIAHVGDMVYAIDFDAPEGTSVIAAYDGIVIAVKDDSSTGGLDQKFENDGNYIEVLHENDEISEYEHLLFQSATVEVGDKVRRGSKIAEVGNTGWSECSHLHFMIYPKGHEYKTLEIVFDKPLNQGLPKDNAQTTPQIINDVGFDFDWDPKKVWALDEPAIELPVSMLTWHFDIPFWNSEGTDAYNLTPKEVIAYPEKEPTHWRLVQDANTDYPIDIMENKGQWLILDGLHRLVKEYVAGKTTVKVRKIPRNRIPEIGI